MSEQGIEFVCVGNNTRSMIAHAVADKYISERNLQVGIFSSGVDVLTMENLLRGNTDPWSLFLGKQFFVDLVRQKIDPTIAEDDALKVAVDIETANRNKALRMKGYSIPKPKSDQTVVRNDVSLILTATPHLVDRVTKLYDKVKIKPEVSDVYSYSGVTAPKGGPENMVSLEFDFLYIALMEEAMPKIISRYLTGFC